MSFYMEKLKAVNIALQALGEYPVSALDTGLPLAGIAQDKVEELNAEQQRLGWWFNIEQKTFNPDDGNEINIPSDIVRVFPLYRTNLRVRAGKLFDPEESSSTFKQEVKATVIRELPWDDLPHSFQKFLAKESGVELQRAFLGSQKIDQFARDERNQAWNQLYAEELENERYNTNTGTADMLYTVHRKAPW